MKQLLTRFLKENYCYAEYKKYFNNWTKNERLAYTKLKDDFNDLICELQPFQLISHAFCWERSYHGHGYWDAINYRWGNFLESKNKIIYQIITKK